MSDILKHAKLYLAAAGLLCLLLTPVIAANTASVSTQAADPEPEQVLEMEEFISLAVKNDTRFEEILIAELAVQYRKDLFLPAADLVLGIRSDYQFSLIQDQHAPDLTVSLDKLFPYTGTEISAAYISAPDFETRPEDFSRTDDRSSSFSVLISQPIAENAFGYVTRLRDRILGLENQVLTYQIVEAYEDYMASLLTLYLDWYEAWENMRVAENSYSENLKLLENMIDRKKSNIALPIDVNKIRLQVLSREETLMNSRIRYLNQRNLIETAVRHTGDIRLRPAVPKIYDDLRPEFESDYRDFRENSRTFDILQLLEEASDLEVRRNANELLPSIELRTGFTSAWDGTGVRDEENILFAGISMEWPFPDEVERAEYETSRIDQRRTRLSTENTYYRLHSAIRNLYEQIERERRLVRIADERIRLSEEVFRDESENYTYGKVSINDYIDSFNALDSNRFNRVFHLVFQKKLIIEAMRLLDRLVTKESIEHDWTA